MSTTPETYSWPTLNSEALATELKLLKTQLNAFESLAKTKLLNLEVRMSELEEELNQVIKGEQ